MKHSAPVTVASKGPQAGGRRIEALLLRGTNTTKLKSSLSLEKRPFSVIQRRSQAFASFLVLFHAGDTRKSTGGSKDQSPNFKLLRSPGIDSGSLQPGGPVQPTTLFVVTACQATKAGGIDSWAP